MPESHLPHERELDDRIRQLVATAVADAPPAPDLAPLVAERPAPPGRRTPWGVLTIGGAAVAATVLGLLVINNDDQAVETPAQPGTVASTVPSETTPGSSAAPSTAVSTTTLGEPAATWTPALVTVADSNVAVSAGLDSRPTVTFAQPAAIALAVGDGRVVGQGASGRASNELTPADTAPWVFQDGAVTSLALPESADRYVELHDLAIVEGRPLLLYSTLGTGVGPAEVGDEELYVVDLDQPDAVASLGAIGTWESGTFRLHLAATGLVVGTQFAEADAGPFVGAVPGSPASAYADGLVTALGLEAASTDCADCPTMFTVDDTGTTVAWLTGDTLVRVPLADGSGTPGGSELVPFPAPAAGVVDVDLLGVPTDYLVTYGSLGGTPPDHAVMLVVGDGDAVPVDADAATWGPGVSTASEPVASAPSPVTTPATAPAPATAATVVEPAVVAAGPDGIGREGAFDGATPGRWAQPATMALQAGDAILFQTQRGGDPRDPASVAASIPQLLAPDGTVTPWVGAASYTGPAAAWRLHDVTTVAGEPWVVYSLVTVGNLLYPGVGPGGSDVYELLDHLYAAPLTGGEPVALGGLGGWESGTARVQAASTGLVVGTFSDGVTHRLWWALLPGASAAPLDPADLGLAEFYSECTTCPNGYGITADGSTMTWLDDGQVVFHRLADGNEQRLPVEEAYAGDGALAWLDGAVVGNRLVAVVSRESADGLLPAIIVTATPDQAVEQRTITDAAATLTG